MFTTLHDRLACTFAKLTKRGVLSESDVDAALREVRRALIEADASLSVVRSFIEKVRDRAIGGHVIRSVAPGQMVIKIVHDCLVDMLGRESQPIDLRAAPPLAIMMVGLQGSGKTTTTAKLARRLSVENKKTVLMASLDTTRPAAQDQLEVLGRHAGIDTLPVIAGQDPLHIARRAMEAARLGGYDVIILDTAGRLHIDRESMQESLRIRDIAAPHETLLVADALSGQDAADVAKRFDEQLGITGIVLTRIDGDGRGGAALSMRAVTGKPVKLLGAGEKLDELEIFHPERIAGRILGRGDVVSLVEKASAAMEAEKADAMAKRAKKGRFDLEDLADQLKQMERIGGMSGILSLLPGVGKVKKQLQSADIDKTMFKRHLAIIASMTPQERRRPKMLNASRKRRIAAGASSVVQEINKLLKMHRQMADMMKKLGQNNGLLNGGVGGDGQTAPMGHGGTGLSENLLNDLPGGLPGLPGTGATGLPGLGGKGPKIPGGG
ncbi:MAG: signal recognition particle protein [Hyphomicrobiales bacterium]